MPSDPKLKAGRRLLREILPWARSEVKKGNLSGKANSPLFGAVAPYVTEDNLEALMIYPAPLGGWHADLYLKKTPPGVPNCLGSPAGKPLPTRAAAEAAGRATVVMALLVAAEQRKQSSPVFLFYDYVFELMPEALAECQAVEAQMGNAKGGYGSKDHATKRIEKLLEEISSEGYEIDNLENWPIEQKTRLVSVLHISALTGVYVYPPRLDRSPSGHAQDDISQTQH